MRDGLTTTVRDGVRYFDTGGPDEPLVLIHGLANSLAFWVPVATAISRRRVIGVDLPGYGQSRRARGSRAEDMIEPVMRLLSSLKVDRCVVVGHSLGGIVALHLVKMAPEHIRSVVLVDAHLFAASDILAGRTPLLSNPGLTIALAAQFIGGLVPMKQPMVRTITASALTRTVFLWPFLGKPTRQDPEVLRSALAGNTGGLEVLRAFTLGRTYDIRATAHDVHCPVDVVWGSNDRLLEQRDHDEIAHRVTVRRILPIPDAGHWALLEQPKTIARFLVET